MTESSSLYKLVYYINISTTSTQINLDIRNVYIKAKCFEEAAQKAFKFSKLIHSLEFVGSGNIIE